MEKLPIYVYYKKQDIHVGFVWKNDNGTFGIDFWKDKIPAFLLPVELFGLNGDLEPTPERTAFWLSERVVPETRQNLCDVLRAYHLDHYDVWDFIKAGGGNVGTDNIFIGCKCPEARRR